MERRAGREADRECYNAWLVAVRKILRTFLGFFLVVAGLILAIPGVPGPGLPVAFLGLVILAEHYHWARRLTEWVKRKVGDLRRKAKS